MTKVKGMRPTNKWNGGRCQSATSGNFLRISPVILVWFSVMTVTLEGAHSPMQKWLHSEWTRKHETPLHWFVQQNFLKVNSSGHYITAYPQSYNSKHLFHKHNGRYVVVRLDRLNRKERANARKILLHHSADEAHFIDDRHVLVYLDSTRAEGLFRTIRTDTAGVSLASTAVLDVLSNPGVARLKLSRVIRTAMNRCGRSPGIAATHILMASAARDRIQLDVRTAPGMEHVVEKALQAVSHTADVSHCQWEVTTVAFGEGAVRWSLAHSSGRRSQQHDMGNKGSAVTCDCASVIDAVVEQPAVRWMEVAVELAIPLNDRATALVQNGKQDATHLVRPLWDAGIDGEGEIIAVADTGIDFDSCFFRDPNEKVAIYPKVNHRHRKVISYAPCDFISGDYHEGDKKEGHGTHVAGTAAGQVLGKANAEYNGVAKGAKIFFRGLHCPSQPMLVLPVDISQIFTPSYSVGARVFSNSWGFFVPPEYSAVEKGIDAFVSKNSDPVLIFPSGNDPSVGLMTPCRSKNTICIGAHMNTFDPTKQNVVSSFSAFGPTYDKRIKPELVGPGQMVTSACSDGDLSTNQCTVCAKRGTSMATAAVAGSAALIRQHLQKLGNVQSPSAALVKTLMIHSSVYLNKSRSSGFGRLDMSLFFKSAGVKGDENKIVRASIVWTDSGVALEGSARSLVNDLDLVIVDSKGKVYYAGEGNTRDSVNVMEQIRLQPSVALAAGFRVIVFGNSIPYDVSQPYAIAVSAPGLNYLENCAEMRVQECANNCSQHGKCVGGVCKCATGYHFVDCSLCDEEVVCNGHGYCTTDNTTCTCDNDNFADSSCSKCKPGWYGSSCTSDCKCSGRGKCNTRSGECMCQQDKRIGGGGCFTGPNCEYCCPGFYGKLCNERSYWCPENGYPVEVSGTDAGYIEVNGYGKYQPMTFCRWILKAPRGHRVRLEYLTFNVDEPTDYLEVMDVGLDEVQPVTHDTGVVERGKVLVSFSNVFLLHFVSGWSRVRKGFALRYSFVRQNDTDCHIPCAENSDCTDMSGGFCACAIGTEGWMCEKESSKDLTSIVLKADTPVGASRFNVSVNKEISFKITNVSTSGPAIHLYIYMADGACSKVTNGLGWRVEVSRNASIANGIDRHGVDLGNSSVVVNENKAVGIASTCRYFGVKIGSDFIAADNSTLLNVTFLHNASLGNMVDDVPVFRAAAFAEQAGSSGTVLEKIVDDLNIVADNTRAIDFLCSYTPPLGVPSMTYPDEVTDNQVNDAIRSIMYDVAVAFLVFLAVVLCVCLFVFVYRKKRRERTASCSGEVVLLSADCLEGTHGSIEEWNSKTAWRHQGGGGTCQGGWERTRYVAGVISNPRLVGRSCLGMALLPTLNEVTLTVSVRCRALFSHLLRALMLTWPIRTGKMGAHHITRN
uniref:Putative subtilisin-like serine peptidase n=1 Tax=Trypanosoma vivax (strain Y486) TaxID=1055687 RepID=G0TT93_TRYVY|nr:putative subtilisin-like serine peptidase, fragment [Trypanosoma vivax Y486]